VSIDLTPAQLRAIVALADHGTFTAAAASLGIAQSSLSRAVQECERRLRLRLFVRTTRRVRLTAEGQAVVQLARDVVDHYDDSLRHLVGYLEGTHGALRVATLPSLAASLLPPFVLAMRRQYPHVRITVDDALGDQVQERLARGQADVAITASSAQPADRQVELPLAQDRFYAAAPAGDPLGDAREVAWADLAGRPLVSFSAASTIRRIVDDALDRHHVRRHDVVEAHNVGSVGGLVAAGLGVAPVPGFVIPLLAFARLQYVPLVPVVAREIVIAYRRSRPVSPVAQAWLDLVLDSRTTRPPLQGVTWHVS
jgi:DNA-binding transcriptional LysR family regulator